MFGRGKETISCVFDTTQICEPYKCGLYALNKVYGQVADNLSPAKGDIDHGKQAVEEGLALSELARLQREQNIQPPCPNSPDPDAFA
jgi:hypothetical protein